MSIVVSGIARAPAGLPLLYATDGAASRRRVRGEYQTGFGWLSTHGHWGVGYCPQPKAIAGRDVAVVAELRAIWHAVHHLLPAGPVTVLVDSTRALQYLTDWATGGRRIPRDYLGSARHTPMVHRLAELVAAHPDHLDARWVRGHSGHLLNECVDCLARLGRRWMSEDLSKDTVRERASWIVEGFLADRNLPEVA